MGTALQFTPSGIPVITLDPINSPKDWARCVSQSEVSRSLVYDCPERSSDEPAAVFYPPTEALSLWHAACLRSFNIIVIKTYLQTTQMLPTLLFWNVTSTSVLFLCRKIKDYIILLCDYSL